jgi:hypothetical protein
MKVLFVFGVGCDFVVEADSGLSYSETVFSCHKMIKWLLDPVNSKVTLSLLDSLFQVKLSAS